MQGKAFQGLAAMLSLSWDVLQGGGAIEVPLTGVLHLAAHGIVPLTLSIVCNNDLDAWTLTVEGMSTVR